MLLAPSIAVVIPNRNDSAHLKKCLDSVLNQIVLPDQIIFVDDQSTDDSLEVVRAELIDVHCATIVSNPICLGTMGALNEGLKYVVSDYVLFLSSNDYVGNGIFERAKTCIATAGSPGVWSAMVQTVDELGQNLHLYPSPVVALTDVFLTPDQCIRLAMTTGHWFTGTTLIYHRETLQKINGFDIAYQGLADLLAALTIASIKGASFSPEPFGVMRQHDEGLMWRTLTNLPLLDGILANLRSTGPQLSPMLFSQRFCEIFERRIRFTAIRAFHDTTWQTHVPLWEGYRYRVVSSVCSIFGKSRRTTLLFAFLLLRPVADVFSIFWYRILGTLLITLRLRNRSL